jgi:hypothetical protein
MLLVLAAGCSGGAGNGGVTSPTASSATATGTAESLATLFPGSSSGGNSKAVKVPTTHVGAVRTTEITLSGPPPGSGTGGGVTVSTARITGDADFQLSDDRCQGRTLGPGDTCTLSVAFTPLAVGGRSAELAVPFSEVGGASGQSYLVHLSGEATSPSITPTAVGPTGTRSENSTDTGAATASAS